MARAKVVFVDVDTQADFMLPDGRLYVRGAEKLLPVIERLRDFAVAQEIPILASTDAHATDDPEFRAWPPHCIRGTAGQLKVPESLLAHYLVVPQERKAPVSDAEMARYGQWILEKDDLDMFTNPQVEDLLQRLDAERYVVYGVATEYCVRLAALGLLRRKQRVALLTDAIMGIDEAGARAAIDQMRAAGAETASSSDIMATAAAA